MVTLACASLAAYLLDLVERRIPAQRPWLSDIAAAADTRVAAARRAAGPRPPADLWRMTWSPA